MSTATLRPRRMSAAASKSASCSALMGAPRGALVGAVGCGILRSPLVPGGRLYDRLNTGVFGYVSDDWQVRPNGFDPMGARRGGGGEAGPTSVARFPGVARLSRPHRCRPTAPLRARRRALHRGVDQGHQARAPGGPPAALGAHDRQVAPGGRGSARRAGSRPAGLRRIGRVAAVPHWFQPAPRRTGRNAPPAAALRAGDRRGRHSDHRARGHRRPHQCRGDLPLRGGARGGRGADHPALRRPVLPAERAREHGHGAADSVDAAAGLAGRGAPCSRTSASPSRRSPLRPAR